MDINDIIKIESCNLKNNDLVVITADNMESAECNRISNALSGIIKQDLGITVCIIILPRDVEVRRVSEGTMKELGWLKAYKEEV